MIFGWSPSESLIHNGNNHQMGMWVMGSELVFALKFELLMESNLLKGLALMFGLLWELALRFGLVWELELRFGLVWELGLELASRMVKGLVAHHNSMADSTKWVATLESQLRAEHKSVDNLECWDYLQQTDIHCECSCKF